VTDLRVKMAADFKPRPYQARFMRYFEAGGRRAVWIVHRRGGKDLTALHQTCRMMAKRPGVYWHVYPTGEQARKAIWEGFRKDGKRILEDVFPGFLDPTRPGSIVARKNESQMVVELVNGSIWRLLGSDKIEVVGAGPVGVVFSEYALAKPNGWDLVRPMLRENGGWAAFITTPRGKNHAHALYEIARKKAGWFHDLQTVHITGLEYESDSDPGKMLSPDEMIAEELASGMPEALVDQEYRCDFTAALVGAVWGGLIAKMEKAGAVAEFDFDRSRVFTTWDLGGAGAKGDATSFWVWAPTDDGADLLGYYENNGKELSHYWDELDQMCAAIGARPVKHWLPHDARAKHLSGVSVLELCAERWGLENVAIYPEHGLLNGIQAGRWLLQRKVRIHPRCSEGLEALKSYHYEWDAEAKVFSNQPAHDWSSHGADAFRGLALVVRESERRTAPPKPDKKPAYVLPVRPTLDQLFASVPKPSGRI
jgi:phage terminase large subunit